LNNCGAVSDINALASCLELQRLLCSGTAVGTPGILALQGCEQLVELDLSHTEVSEVNHLVKCPLLLSANIFGAVNMTPAGYAALGNRQGDRQPIEVISEHV
jgi:hypothetical protein